MKTKNYFIKKNTFINFSYWSDYVGFFILPTFIIDKNLPISPLVTISRITVCFLKFRFALDIGKKKEEKPYDWKNSNMNNFIQWWRKEIKKPITKEKFEEFIDEDETAKDLLTVNNIEFYYVKKYLYKNYIKYLQQNQ